MKLRKTARNRQIKTDIKVNIPLPEGHQTINDRTILCAHLPNTSAEFFLTFASRTICLCNAYSSRADEPQGHRVSTAVSKSPFSGICSTTQCGNQAEAPSEAAGCASDDRCKSNMSRYTLRMCPSVFANVSICTIYLQHPRCGISLTQPRHPEA